VDLDVVLRTKSHEIADRISDRLEEDILSQFPRVVMSRIRPHFDYSPTLNSVMPVTRPEGNMAENIAKAPWFLIETRERETGKVQKREFIENPYWREERKRGYLVGKWLLSLKPDQIEVASDREGTAIALLKEAGVEVIRASADKTVNTNTS
jgi:predicted Fe-Mo cluster-binding NifX family protein